jgi:transcriptional regulator of acetoin/glycerol metabolism
MNLILTSIIEQKFTDGNQTNAIDENTKTEKDEGSGLVSESLSELKQVSGYLKNEVQTYKKDNGRRKNAAKELGISERTLYRKIKEFEILK